MSRKEIRLTPRSRPQMFLDNRLLSMQDKRQKEVEEWIKDFARQLGRKGPLYNKYDVFCDAQEKWAKAEQSETAGNGRMEMERLRSFLLFLMEHDICFADTRERLVSQTGRSLSAHNMDCAVNRWMYEDLDVKSYKPGVQAEIRRLLAETNKAYSKGLSYVVKEWFQDFERAYPQVTADWGVSMLCRLLDRCEKRSCKLKDVFQKENGQCSLFQREARLVLEETLCAEVTDEQYEVAIMCFIPKYCRAESLQEQIQPRAPQYHPAINEAIWDRYQESKGWEESFRAFLLEAEKLMELKTQLYDFLEKKHAVPLSPEYDALPAILKERLRHYWPEQKEEDIFSHACEVSCALQTQIIAADPKYRMAALLWFFYLTKGYRLLADQSFRLIVPPLNLKKQQAYAEKKYEEYKDLFLELQKAFPPGEEAYRVLQQELFLILCQFSERGAKDPDFSALLLTKTYKLVLACLEDQIRTDPALLISYPWNREQREEYKRTGSVKLYEQIFEWFHSDKAIRFLEKERRRLKSSWKLEPDRSDPSQMDVLYEMFEKQGETYVGQDHLPHRKNPPGNLMQYALPKDIPGAEDPELYEAIVPCIREYLAFSLWRKELACAMKEEWKCILKALK